jgi:hypothetical protein
MAQFRLETGHDLLAKHLHKLWITDSNECSLCATEQHIRGHLLSEMPQTRDIRDALPKNMAEPEKESYLYWETRKRMIAKQANSVLPRQYFVSELSHMGFNIAAETLYEVLPLKHWTAGIGRRRENSTWINVTLIIQYLKFITTSLLIWKKSTQLFLRKM